MNEVPTDKIWREVAKRARSALTRKTAIAYVTNDDIGLREGDVLVPDTSPRAIRSGQMNFVNELRLINVRPHVAQNLSGPDSGSANASRRASAGKTVAGLDRPKLRGGGPDRTGIHLRCRSLQSCPPAQATGGGHRRHRNWPIVNGPSSTTKRD